VQINPEEVASWRWISMDDLKKDIDQNPDLYTIRFKIIFDKYCELIS